MSPWILSRQQEVGKKSSSQLPGLCPPWCNIWRPYTRLCIALFLTLRFSIFLLSRSAATASALFAAGEYQNPHQYLNHQQHQQSELPIPQQQLHHQHLDDGATTSSSLSPLLPPPPHQLYGGYQDYGMPAHMFQHHHGHPHQSFQHSASAYNMSASQFYAGASATAYQTPATYNYNYAGSGEVYGGATPSAVGIKSEYIPTPYVTPSPTLDLNSSAEVDSLQAPTQKLCVNPLSQRLMETASNSSSLRSIYGSDEGAKKSEYLV